MMKIFHILLLLSGIISLCVGFPSQVFSQTSTPSGVQDIQTTEIKGEVLRRQNRTLTVQSNDNTQDITVPEYVKVTRNTNQANIEDIQPGDSITILQASDGQVLSAAATAGEIFDLAKWLLPLLLLLALGVILTTYFLRKSSQLNTKNPSNY